MPEIARFYGVIIRMMWDEEVDLACEETWENGTEITC